MVSFLFGTPKGIRTPVAAVKGQCPRPLDDRGIQKLGAPGAIRTPDPLVRSQILYPTELRVRILAEKEGFEPSIQVLPVCTLSRGVPSTTRPLLQKKAQSYIPVSLLSRAA